MTNTKLVPPNVHAQIAQEWYQIAQEATERVDREFAIARAQEALRDEAEAKEMSV